MSLQEAQLLSKALTPFPLPRHSPQKIPVKVIDDTELLAEYQCVMTYTLL